MDSKKAIPFILAGAAFGLHEVHEGHQVAAEVEKRFSNQTKVDVPLLCCLRHGNEPAQPGGPLRTPWTVAASTASSVASSTVLGPELLNWPRSS